RVLPRYSQCPFRVGGDSDPPRRATLVPDTEQRQLYRFVLGHSQGERGRELALEMVEGGPARAVAHDEGSRIAAGTGGRPPDGACILITQVKKLSRRIAHGIVVPRCQTEEVTASSPGTPASALRDEEPSARIRDDVGPGRGRHGALPYV